MKKFRLTDTSSLIIKFDPLGEDSYIISKEFVANVPTDPLYDSGLWIPSITKAPEVSKINQIEKGDFIMADFLLWIFLIVWSVWGVIHFARRIGITLLSSGLFVLTGGYKIKSKEKKIIVLFAEGPIVWACCIVKIILKTLWTIFKVLVVAPSNGLDEWAQKEEEKEDGNEKEGA